MSVAVERAPLVVQADVGDLGGGADVSHEGLMRLIRVPFGPRSTQPVRGLPV